MTYRGKLYVHNISELKEMIPDEYHERPFVGNLNDQTMIMAFRKTLIFPGMKKEFMEYLS